MPYSDNRRQGNNCSVQDPVHVGTGNVYLEEEEDVALAGGLLSFSRHYNSSDPIYGSDGTPNIKYSAGNWRGDYLAALVGSYGSSIRITLTGTQTIKDATAVVTRPDGRNIRYYSQYDSTAKQFTAPWSSTESSLKLTTVAGPTAWAALDLSNGKGWTERYAAVSTAEARPSQVLDTQGNALLTLTRSGAKVTAVTDMFGNTLEFEYNANYALSKLKVNGAVWATYTYNSQKFLSNVQYADGNCRQYFYEDPNFPSGLSRVEQKACAAATSTPVAVWQYDTQGRAIYNSIGGAMSGEISYIDGPPGGSYTSCGLVLVGGENVYEYVCNYTEHPAGNDRAIERFPNGLVNTYTLGTRGGRDRVTRKTRTVGNVTADYFTTYDAAGNIVRTQDWNGSVTTYTFNERNLETSRTSAFGTPQAYTINTEWHPALNKPTRVTTPARETVYTYAGDNLIARTETDLTAWASGTRTWTYSYTGQGLLAAVDGPLPGTSDTTTYTYTERNDAAGIKGGRLLSVTNPLGHVTQITAHNALGDPATVIDPNGITTQIGYDARGRVISLTRVDPVLGNLVTTYQRDAAGNVTRITLPDGSFTQFEYNAIGQVMAIQDATGARIEHERDAESNIVRTHVRHANGALVRRLEQTWDGLKQLTAVTGLSTTHATYQYDNNGNVVRSANGLDLAVQNVHDALDRITASTDATGAQTQFGYDASGNLATVTDPRTLSTAYEYDGFNCLRRQTSPDTGVTTYTCDKAGNVTGKTDARGVTATYGRDALGRLTSTVYGNAPSEMALFGYDATAGGNKGIGRLTAAQNDGADVARKYDARGNLVEDSRSFDGRSYVTAYAYDSADRLATITYPSGRVVNYIRNAAGQVTGVITSASATGSQTVAGNMVWAPFGGIASFTNGNGLAETRAYDTDGMLTGISVGALLSRSYSRDAAGRITAITDADPSRSETYTYSDADRLTGATGAYGMRTWSYDAVGNRTSQTRNSNASQYTYGQNSNRLYQVTGNGPLTLDYDAAGNTLAKDSVQLAYNAANRLKTVTVPSGNSTQVFTYAYTALGERVVKTNGTTTTHFHYNPQGQLLAESKPDGSVIREYIWLDDAPLAMVAKRINGTQFELFAVHNDHLGTALALTDSTQQVVWRYNREPFGQLSSGSNMVNWPLRFPGQYQDWEAGFVYNYFRDYDPQTGRYIESDPIGLGGGINTYAYAEGNPVINTDPRGLKTLHCTKPLHRLEKVFGSNGADFAYRNIPLMYHQYSCVIRNGHEVCHGQEPSGSPIWSDGQPSSDTSAGGTCSVGQPDNDCFESCLMDEWYKPRPMYGIPFGKDCQNFDDDVNAICKKQCGIR